MLRARVLAPLVVALAIVAGVLGHRALRPESAGAAGGLPPIGHVWVIELENKSFDQAFVDNTSGTYLWKTLPAAGELLRQYYGTGHASLDNYLSELAGQAPNADTQGDCQVNTDIAPGTIGIDGQALGQGCTYPAGVRTLADQLEVKGLSWKGYMQDLGNDPARDDTTPGDPGCGAPPLGKSDATQKATATDQYAARHNPFVYFHSILDTPGRCAAHVKSLDPLPGDLASVATTPSFSFITPNLCDDGHDPTPCAGTNTKGTKEGGLIGADAFLSTWVPRIMASPAYKKDGLIIVTLDESGDGTDDSCCNEPSGLNTPSPGIGGPGGGRIGTVLLSRYVTPGSVNDTPYNHYALLRSLEDIFGIDEHLGYAGAEGLKPFGADVFNNPSGSTTTMPGPLPPGDAGSTGAAKRLRITAGASVPALARHLRRFLVRAGGLPVRVHVTGTDRLLANLSALLVRVRGRRAAVVASSGHARTLTAGRGTLRLKLRRGARILPGRYEIRVVAREEDVRTKAPVVRRRVR